MTATSTPKHPDACNGCCSICKGALRCKVLRLLLRLPSALELQDKAGVVPRHQLCEQGTTRTPDASLLVRPPSSGQTILVAEGSPAPAIFMACCWEAAVVAAWKLVSHHGHKRGPQVSVHPNPQTPSQDCYSHTRTTNPKRLCPYLVTGLAYYGWPPMLQLARKTANPASASKA